MDDGDGGVVDEGQDAFASVLDADAEVVHAAGAAQAHFSVVCDVVVANPIVGFCRRGRWGGFGGRPVSGGGRGAVVRVVRSARVVVIAEPVELFFQVADRAGGGLLDLPSPQGDGTVRSRVASGYGRRSRSLASTLVARKRTGRRSCRR